VVPGLRWGSFELLDAKNARIKRKQSQPGAGAHACNPSWSGGRDQEACGLKPAKDK
jgi:hypothetical protein